MRVVQDPLFIFNYGNCMMIAMSRNKSNMKHMKNLKKKEYLEKINKVRKVAGIGDSEAFKLDVDDLEDEFDPNAHDRKMKKMFNDKYYGANDVNPEFCSGDEEDGEDFKKPDFDKEDLLLSLSKGWDKDDEKEDEEEGEEGKKKRKRKASKESVDGDLEEKYKKKLEDELHKLDYEGTIGDLKTRFPYRKVKPKRFGLSAEEILMMDDPELNQYVSLKKIAPYTEKEWKVPSIKRYEQKLKNKELIQNAKLGKHEKKKSLKNDDGKKSVAVKEDKEDDNEQVDGDTESTSRQTKRRRRQRELKLSQPRLWAYGKIDPKPKR